MNEYIERAAAVKVVLRERKPTNSVPQNRMLSIIQRDLLTMRAADVAPVVHGRWIKGPSNPYCSECFVECRDETPFCPNCGAKMYGGECDEAD
nr:MAG TPA: PROTEIN/RNA Complex, archaeal, ribosomal, 50S, protein.0A [Caudoviricetes sp.]